MISEKDKLLSHLQNLCARKEYCSSEIFRKAVKALDGDESLAAEIVSSLVEDKFVDDLRYAGAFARDKSCLEGWGPVKISWMLSSKGIDRKTISEALGTVDEDKAARKLRSLIEARHHSLKGCDDERLRLLKYALSRGYEYDKVSPLVHSVLSDG